ncbi:MAG: arylsulfatase [Candidatus Hydrogenedentota bacterium]
MTNKALTRRDFLGLSAAAANLAIPTLYGDASAGSTGAIQKPNIIFIMADDLGYADLGCYGQPKIKTPHIDRLAAEGMRFTHCYAGASVCAPSRSVLMTGLHGGHTTVRDNHGVNAPTHDGEEGRIPLKEDDVTVAEVLKEAGYATGITGKWGLGEPGSTGVPNDQGFDEWFGYLNQSHAADYFTDHLWRNKNLQTIEANEDGRRGAYSCDLFSEFSLDFIRKNQANPFFLYVATTIPHKKLEVPDLEIYTEKPWPDEAKVFAAMVTRMDTHVGQIMDLLKELGLDEKTIVFFTSDNGSAEGWEGMFDSSGPLRDKKFSLYEGGIRCPMIARWPGRIPAGEVSDAVWHFADILPTAATLAGARVPNRVDGTNVAPILLGETDSLPNRFLYWEKHRDEPVRLEQAVRWGDWKGIRLGLDKPLELYNLKDDIAEENDVSSRHPDIVSHIESYLNTARTPSPYWPVPNETKEHP